MNEGGTRQARKGSPATKAAPEAGDGWSLDLDWLTQLQPGHQADAGPEHTAAIKLRTAL